MEAEAIQGHPDNPILHLGLDLGVRRDTAAVAACYQDPRDGVFVLFDWHIFQPPVLIADFMASIYRMLALHTVAGIWADHWQMMAELQKLEALGYGRIIHEVIQGTESVAFSNCLKSHLDDGTYLFPADPERRNQYRWANVEVTERGWKITKKKQSRPIDTVVAEAMALYGATKEAGGVGFQGYSEKRHSRSIFSVA